MNAARAAVVLASLNLHGCRRADRTPFDARRACTQLDAAVIALQEMWWPDGGPDPAAEAAAELGAQVIRASLLTGITLRAVSIADEKATGAWGLAVITSLPVAGHEVFPLGRALGDRVPRAALAVVVELPGGGRLRIVNTHLTHRFTSPVQLLRLVRLLEGPRVPTVITGDLNMPGPMSGLAAGYSPVVGGRTFPAHRPAVQLDHMLTGRGITGSGGQVLAPVGSDHLPIRARLAVS